VSLRQYKPMAWLSLAIVMQLAVALATTYAARRFNIIGLAWLVLVIWVIIMLCTVCAQRPVTMRSVKLGIVGMLISFVIYVILVDFVGIALK
jgi:hypothetical protein